MVNNEDVAKLIEYLSTPEAGKIWVSTGAIVSPNKGVTEDAYPNPLVTKEAEQVKNAESFRFDGSDLLPGTLGQEFGTLLQTDRENAGEHGLGAGHLPGGGREGLRRAVNADE